MQSILENLHVGTFMDNYYEVEASGSHSLYAPKGESCSCDHRVEGEFE